MRRINLAACAAIAWAVSCSFVGAVSAQPAGNAAPSRTSEVGRYVIVHSPHIERDTILLDTVTGRTWELESLTYLNDDPDAWEPVPQLNSQSDRDAIAALDGRKPKDAPPTPN
jgi:hypothetical protein